MALQMCLSLATALVSLPCHTSHLHDATCSQVTSVGRQKAPVTARRQVNGPELHGDVEPVKDAAGRPGGAIDCLCELAGAVSEDGDPVVLSNAAGGQELLQAISSRRYLVVDIGVESCFPAFEARPSGYEVDVPALLGYGWQCFSHAKSTARAAN